MTTPRSPLVRLFRYAFSLTALLTATSTLAASEPVLTPNLRDYPGVEPTPSLRYLHPGVPEVLVSGSWDGWAERTPMEQQDEYWVLDVKSLALPAGRHEYKFIIRGDWESGPNRSFYINDEGLLERPSEQILSARIESPDKIHVVVAGPLPRDAAPQATLRPSVELASVEPRAGLDEARYSGYRIVNQTLGFVFDEAVYGLELGPTDRVAVAGNFNGWNPNQPDSHWELQRDESRPRWWTTTLPLDQTTPPAGETERLFKFVVNGQQWFSPVADALNAVDDGRGNVNLRIEPEAPSKTLFVLRATESFDLGEAYTVFVEGLAERALWAPVTAGLRLFDHLKTYKTLGVELDRERGVTTYRLFAPRASSVVLCMYDQPYHEVHQPEHRRIQPTGRYPMWQDEDGVWEISRTGLDIGKYYSFNIDGPRGPGEGFNPFAQVGDPYALAVPHARNNPMIIDPDATNQWFSGWTDDDWTIPPHEDLIIYETHVRHFTMHPSSDVTPKLRGKFAGVTDSLGRGTGLDHLKALGVNAIEFMPMQEFDNNENDHNWGYATTYFFAPEASFGLDPLNGSQYYEFKALVNELHNQGFAVLIDVVYNHAGWPNVFEWIDRKYYFRLNDDYTYSNYSGVGTDFRSESPMMRRLIIDNVLYWMKEFHVDGFRFDLAELIDMDTLLQLRDEARALNPDVILISEPWSFRGEHKSRLRGTTWAAWNNDFRNAAKEFATGRHNRDWLAKAIFGSVETWTENPIQAVQYVESHDDMALADEISSAPGRDGRSLIPEDIQRNKLTATATLTSLGIVMIAEGQEYLRSKHGISNTYDRGDELNALNWNDRDRPRAREAMAYYKDLTALRNSDPGRAFRVAERPQMDYYQWIMPPQEERALGYIVNAPRQRAGNGFVVLLNAADRETSFDVPFPAGTWRLIGDGDRVALEGLEEHATTVPGGNTVPVPVPALTAYIFMDGF